MVIARVGHTFEHIWHPLQMLESIVASNVTRFIVLSGSGTIPACLGGT